MKRLLLVLLLSVVLTMTFATPVLADGPKGDMPDEGITGLQNALPNIGRCWAGGYGKGNGLAVGPSWALSQIWRAIDQGCPPGQAQ